MQCEDLEIQLPAPKLNDLDSALHELGMLSTCTNSRREYLRETHNKRVLNMLSINTRYVSNVSIGFRVRSVPPHIRYKPYNITSKERHRTRSENNDNNEVTSLVKAVLEETLSETVDDLTQLKKSKSLESIVAEDGGSNSDSTEIQNTPEVEIVSNCIEKLKVFE